MGIRDSLDVVGGKAGKRDVHTEIAVGLRELCGGPPQHLVLGRDPVVQLVSRGSATRGEQLEGALSHGVQALCEFAEDREGALVIVLALDAEGTPLARTRLVKN